MSYVRYRNWLMESDTRDTEVSYEEWLAGTFPNDTALQRQYMVAAMVSGEMPRHGRPGQMFNELALNADDDLKVGLAAMARSKMSRVTTLMGFADMVEAKLMQRVSINEASNDQLLAMARYLRGSVKDDVGMVMNAIEATQKKSGLEGAQFNVSMGDSITIGDSAMKGRDTRDRIRTVLDGMLKVVAKNAATPQPESPAA